MQASRPDGEEKRSGDILGGLQKLVDESAKRTGA